jgi:AmmeMemoRadiSam system protein B
VHELLATGKFTTMSTSADETEHSMEMHLPYIYKMLSGAFKSATEHPTLIPILVGNTSAAAEKSYGDILAPYLADPTSVFVVSSDFCHWGLRFQYTRYLPASPTSAAASSGGVSLKRGDDKPRNPPIYESIGRLDRMAMDAVEGGQHEEFLDNLRETGNTVCGRHPIGVVMAAIEALREQGTITDGEKGRFKFVRYERSSEVEEIRDSSVSYASAFAVV